MLGRLARVAAAEKLSCSDNILLIILETLSAALYSYVGIEVAEEVCFSCSPMTAHVL